MEWISNFFGSIFSALFGGGGQGNWLSGILKMFGFGGDNAQQQPSAPAEVAKKTGSPK